MIVADCDVPNANNWCFVIGFARTGTSIMGELINHHPKARMLLESWLWGYADLLQERTYQLQCANYVKYLENTTYYKAKGIPDSVGTEIRNTQMRPIASENCVKWNAASIRMIMEGLRSALGINGDFLFGDKHWNYRIILDDLVKVFPNCNLVLTTRNEWDFAASSMDAEPFIMRRPQLTKMELAEVALERARQQIEEDKNIKNTYPNVYEVKFEDMATSPQATLASLFDYLEISISDYDWDRLKSTRYASSLGHWEQITELVELRQQDK